MRRAGLIALASVAFVGNLARPSAQQPRVSSAPEIAEPPRGTAPADETTLDLVLKRAADYVAEFSRKVSGLVAEESYVQDATNQHRELKSDFLLVQVPGEAQYVEFRDVFEVDGHAVRDRQDRLARLFLKPSESQQQMGAIVAESARYNIGRVSRTVNTPMLPLQFLAADVQGRFEFKRTTDAKPSRVTKAEMASGPFAVGPGVWVIEYRETSRGTIIRRSQGRDLPASGRFWIEPQTGRVLMSELHTEEVALAATIDVSYQSEPLLGMSVPVEMRELYDPLATRGGQVRGTAKYGRFRHFRVTTDEVIAPPPVR